MYRMEPSYDRVSSSEDGLDEPKKRPEPQRLRPWARNILLLSCLASALTGAVFGSISSTLTTSAVSHFHVNVNDAHASDLSPSSVVEPVSVEAADFMLDCGDTPAKARAQGCIFDTMLQLWVPPACLDSKLTERFVAEGNWTWYADKKAQHPIPYEVLSRGDHQVAFAADNYHRSHCYYTWEVLVRALRNHSPIMEEMISYDHVMHCRMAGLLPMEYDKTVAVEIHPGYTKCAPYSTWIRNLPEDKHSSLE
ncbi:uncharacterized protein N7482_006245 [Penicillium canariense]|uniref:Uncharacterized protein n=1 Tax=Penicillium canariense TaxID=189055 RepID=A0A9W9I6B6_9EURO|nr:uncharacterized protein N7482_006245 [Penicillium canariense]KAJ5167464.1 hypothetical protein N7482_006245 [Penicillium canariense]